MTIQTIYLKNIYALDRFQATVDRTIVTAELLQKKFQFDTIAFCGMSGAAMAFILSRSLNLPLICVRKESDTCHFHGYFHHQKFLEGNMAAKSYLIVDDFIDSGNTIDWIVSSIKKEIPAAQCVSLLMYAEPIVKTWQHKHWKEPLEVISSRIEA